MDNQLSALIAMYEEEKRALELLIKNFLEDIEGPDYFHAGLHQNALYLLNGSIRQLKTFEDPLYDEKQNTARLISIYEERVAAEKNEFLKAFEEKQLKRYKEVQKELDAIQQPERETDRTLDTVLSQLVNGQIKKCKIIFNRDKNISLTLTSKRKVISITSTKIKEEGSDDLELLENLGFTLDNNKLRFSILNTGEETLQKLQYILIRLVFDVWYFRNTSDSAIEL